MTSLRPDHPTVALAMGDPAGISPELAAKALALQEVRGAANFVVFGDRRILQRGAEIAKATLDIDVVAAAPERAPGSRRPVLVDLAHLSVDEVTPATATLAGGRFAAENFRQALLYAKAGHADAVSFTPFNKKAMRYAYPGYDDEIRFINDVLGRSGAGSEFNILDRLWNARVTSHIPLSEVARSITQAGIVDSLALTDAEMRRAGFATPRIAVAALNPHAGDGGNFGREEIDIIAPAVAVAAKKGINVDGPFPSDTVFLRARNGAFDAVLTMFHDQGQIAMKLMGFDRGVTLLGGLPFSICTPAHGTAYDIAGKGIADIGATRAALLLAARMGAMARAAPQAAARAAV
jgi:4-hydroxythreonine-4-phosphate dehydrogenase